MISGTVTDETGNVVPGAQVSIRNEATGEGRQMVTDDKGGFAIPSVPPGSYSVQADLQGFKTYKTTHLQVHHGDRMQVRIVLTVGDVVETISVVADRDVIQTSTGERGAVLTPELWEAGGGGGGGGGGGWGDGINLKFWTWGRKEKVTVRDFSSNVAQLQQRAQGILPVRVSVPRTGRSLHFVRPLIVDEETIVTLRYKRKR